MGRNSPLLGSMGSLWILPLVAMKNLFSLDLSLSLSLTKSWEQCGFCQWIVFLLILNNTHLSFSFHFLTLQIYFFTFILFSNFWFSIFILTYWVNQTSTFLYKLNFMGSKYVYGLAVVILLYFVSGMSLLHCSKIIWCFCGWYMHRWAQNCNFLNGLIFKIATQCSWWVIGQNY